MENVLTVKEAAFKLSLNEETIRRLIRDGRIKAVRTGEKGGHYRIPQMSIDNFLDDHERPTKN